LGNRYFAVPENCGVLVRPGKVTPLPADPAASATAMAVAGGVDMANSGDPGGHVDGAVAEAEAEAKRKLSHMFSSTYTPAKEAVLELSPEEKQASVSSALDFWKTSDDGASGGGGGGGGKGVDNDEDVSQGGDNGDQQTGNDGDNGNDDSDRNVYPNGDGDAGEQGIGAIRSRQQHPVDIGAEDDGAG
jgi:hypothetical protein